jgi:hypothetical protein
MKEPYKKGVANHLGPEGADAVKQSGRPQDGSRYSRDDHRPARSKAPDKPGNSMRENRETPGVPDSGPEGERDER